MAVSADSIRGRNMTAGNFGHNPERIKDSHRLQVHQAPSRQPERG